MEHQDHRCRRGEHCADHETVDGTRIGRAINAADGLCDHCGQLVERAITALPADYVQLNLILGAGTTVGGEPVSMTRDLPIPIRVHIEALQRDMVREAAAWAASVAAVLRIDWRTDRTRPGHHLDRACRLLLASPSVLLALRDEKHIRWEYDRRVLVARDGLDGALALLQLHQRARVHLGHTRLTHRLPVPCPRCEEMALQRDDGSEEIDCVACSRRYTWAEYEKLCLILVDREERKCVVV